MSAPANREIWSLVSGFPSPVRERRLMLMFQGYFDESDQKNGFFVLAGFLARTEAWADLSDRWAELLGMSGDTHRPWEEVHLSQIDRTPENIERLSFFYREIESHVTAAAAICVNRCDLNDAIDRYSWPKFMGPHDSLKNPYLFGFKFIVGQIIDARSDLNIDGPIDFIFDERSEKTEILRAWDTFKEAIQEDDPGAANYIGDPPIFRNSHKTMPLQAADLWAWHVRKWAEDGVLHENMGDLALPWNTTKDLRRILLAPNRDQLAREIGRMHDEAMRVKSQIDFQKHVESGQRFY